MPSGADELAAPREAFSLLGHDIRLEILLALLDHWQAAKTVPQRYSELMSAVEMEDSGKFNYHLDKLRGAYLQQTESGYVPTASATALYRAVLAHRPTQPSAQSELTFEAACPECQEPLGGTYERSFLTVRCPACESPRAHFTYPLPQKALEDRTDDELLATVSERARSEIGLARTGQCPDWAGTTTTTVCPDERGTPGEPPVEISCTTCTWLVRTGVLLPLLSDARVTSTLLDLGVAVEASFPWELPEPSASIASTDPRKIALQIDTERGAVTVLVDGSLSVESVTLNGGVSEQEMDGTRE
jgi:hypothetical protein